jgi:3-oxoacyl-[acyl-carrier protein] reductase
MSLSGKVVLITGSSRGIGKATALRLASEGASVVINYVSNEASANSLVEQIGSDRALAVQADASNMSDLDRLVHSAVAKFGKIDVLIPNAGILPMKDLENTTEADFDKTYNLMVKGPYFLAQVSTRILSLKRPKRLTISQKAAKHIPSGGRIIFVSTGVTVVSNIAPTYLLYASAKGAIEQMARVMAKDLARKGILVNAIAPGPTTTELFLEGKSEQVLKAVAGSSPFGRVGEPDEIASVMSFLCGKDSSWMSGQVLRVNGAMT